MTRAIGLVLLAVVWSLSPAWAQCGACEYNTGNLVTNGDFSAGNSGFTTDYELATVPGTYGLLSNEGFYVIDNNAADVHDNFQGFDHTLPPLGDYMIVNGSGIAGTAVWCQTIPVLPGLEYTFSAWARNVDTNPDNDIHAELQFMINGDLIGPLVEPDGGWEEFNVTWFSADLTEIDICIFNQQTNVGGNDFGIDDISFEACYPVIVEHVLNAGPDVTFCSGESISIGEETDGFNYTWEADVSISDVGAGLANISLINPGTEPLETFFVLQADTAGLGCIQTDTVFVSVLPLPQPDLGEDIIICEGETATLNAGSGWDSVEWEDGSIENTFSTDIPGTYSVIVVEDGCSNSDALEVIQPSLPEINLPADSAICEDQVLLLDAIEPGGMWSTGDEGAFLSVSESGTYVYTVDVLGCETSDSTTISVIEYPLFDLGADLDLCPEDTLTLVIPFIGNWSTGAVGTSIEVSSEGSYGVTVAIEHCARFDDIEIISVPGPVANLGEDFLLCPGTQRRIETPYSSSYEYDWNTGDSGNEIIIDTEGLYLVEVANSCGITADTLLVTEGGCGHSIYAPSGFTPNGDGLNEYWQVFANEMEKFQIRIFNRWGELVFESTDPEAIWYGNYLNNNSFVPNGVYVYRITGQALNQELVDEMGWITMIR